MDAVLVGELILWREDVPFAAMPALYNGASVVALVSHYEGFGFPILEGMACGVPFVASDRGSLPEVAGEVGLAVNPDAPEEIAAALARALTDSAWRAAARAAGLARAKEFTWAETARVVRAVYQRVLSR